MTGRQVAAAVIAIALATAVIPPAAAYAVNQRRVARATAQAAELATALGSAPPIGEVVLVGPGRLPIVETDTAQPWLNRPRRSLMDWLPRHAVSADPWGNCYLAVGTVVLSAGPNGIIDTPFGAASPAGDDLTSR